MSDLSWSAALTLLCLVSSGVLIAVGTRRRAKKKNRRLGLPSPACNRFPAWDDNTRVETRRELR
jgi:hypothetical protein